MKYLKQHKELIPLMIVVIILALAAQNLFKNQQKNAGLLNSGTVLAPSSFSGRTTCEIPIPDLYSREYSGRDHSIKIETSKQKEYAN